MVSSDDGSDERHGRPWGPGWTDLGSWEADLAIGWRRCHSQMVWQAIVAVVVMTILDQDAADAWNRLNDEYRPPSSRK